MASKIGPRPGRPRSRCRLELVGNRSGQTVFRSAAPAASATASATAWPPLAARGLIGANLLSGLLLGFVLVGFAFLSVRNRVSRHRGHAAVVTRGATFAGLAG